MTDIIYGERLKKVFRMMLKLGYKTLKKDMVMIGQDLGLSQNPVVRNLNSLLILAAAQLRDHGTQWQKDATLGYGQAFLWLLVKDTGYRDMFFWTLDKALEHPEEFKKMLKPYVKQPDEWIPNQWVDSIDKTKLLRRKKKIPINAKSLEETIFTKTIQDKRHKELLK